ncbi:MAG: hypothetical protein M0017_09345 [Desulfobacteraceae bacterium]|nr:hypothetical protein [Desulfobacteraceae bacterium]
MILLKKFICTACGHEWELPLALGENHGMCPACGREKAHRIDAGVRRQDFEPARQDAAAAGQVQL